MNNEDGISTAKRIRKYDKNVLIIYVTSHENYMKESFSVAVIENGSMQDIFSVLKIGVYDYIETIDDLEKYQKKIQDIILWDWYLKKYKGG